jgi:hypothetical protein
VTTPSLRRGTSGGSVVSGGNDLMDPLKAQADMLRDLAACHAAASRFADQLVALRDVLLDSRTRTTELFGEIHKLSLPHLTSGVYLTRLRPMIKTPAQQATFNKLSVSDREAYFDDYDYDEPDPQGRVLVVLPSLDRVFIVNTDGSYYEG